MGRNAPVRPARLFVCLFVSVSVGLVSADGRARRSLAPVSAAASRGTASRRAVRRLMPQREWSAVRSGRRVIPDWGVAAGWALQIVGREQWMRRAAEGGLGEAMFKVGRNVLGRQDVPGGYRWRRRTRRCCNSATCRVSVQRLKRSAFGRAHTARRAPMRALRVCVRACVHMCACVHECSRACEHACVSTCVRAYMCACVHVCVRAFVRAGAVCCFACRTPHLDPCHTGAVSWFRRAIAAGDPDAAYQMAQLLLLRLVQVRTCVSSTTVRRLEVGSSLSGITPKWEHASLCAVRYLRRGRSPPYRDALGAWGDRVCSRPATPSTPTATPRWPKPSSCSRLAAERVQRAESHARTAATASGLCGPGLVE